jgi:hypothetical protein
MFFYVKIFLYMQKEITKEEFWEIYKGLPEELQDAIFAEKTAEEIFNACTENGVEDERISAIAKQAGHVLLGILPIREFKLTLELDMNLEPACSENIYNRINGSIFEPVKPQLQEISAPGWRPKEEAPAEKIAKTAGEENDAIEEPAIAEEKIEISRDNLPAPELISEDPVPAPPPSLGQKIRRTPASEEPKEPPAPPKDSDSYRESVG